MKCHCEQSEAICLFLTPIQEITLSFLPRDDGNIVIFKNIK